MDYQFLYIVVAGIPFAATVMDWLGSAISERHHSHHDTYEAPSALFHALVVVMVGMGLLGVIAGIYIGHDVLRGIRDCALLHLVWHEALPRRDV